MRDRSDRYQVQPVPSFTKPKRIGSYLVEAGLLTDDQVKVALNDQQATGMRFGDIIVARGWLKEQTIEWVMQKVIIPEKRALNKQQEQIVAQRQTLQQQSLPQPIPNPSNLPTSGQSTGHASPRTSPSTAKNSLEANSFNRRNVPISKPLPPVQSSDGDVNWVG
jgi:hypothetical protein